MSAETKNFIAGKWVATGSTFDSVNPATGELVSRCAEASQQELDAAVAAACDAFPAWRRAEILFRVAELLKARKDDLARWITFEMGKVTMEARGDVQEAIDMARYMAGEGRHSGALRQIFTQAEKREGEPFTVLELTERHFGFKGFSPPQAQGLMESTVAHKKAA